MIEKIKTFAETFYVEFRCIANGKGYGVQFTSLHWQWVPVWVNEGNVVAGMLGPFAITITVIE